jgi:protein SCO1
MARVNAGAHKERLRMLLLMCGVIAGLNSLSAAAEDLLPRVGKAPAFTLTNQDGRRFSLSDARGKVTVVTFIFTTCSETCPVLTAKLVAIERALAPHRGHLLFAAITVDPLQDTPARLKKYGEAHGADSSAFVFLTGSIPEIESVSKSYAVFRKNRDKGGIDHTFLTSLVDRKGVLRVQYIGTRFDPAEFRRDLEALLKEAA